MERWASQTLSFAGRVELIKSVLHGMATYWLLSFKMPVSVCKELEKLFANFLWHGKLHAYSWSELCKPKKEGGVGIRRITDVNNAAGLKLFWRLNTSQSLRASWMKERYCKGYSMWEAPISGSWKFIASLRNVAVNAMAQNLNSARWI